MAQIGTSIKEAVNILNEHGVIGLPTETVYGLAGNALSEKAISTIYQVKERPAFDPLIAHVSSLSQALDLVEYLPEAAAILAKAFWPGPITLLLKKKPKVPFLLTSGSDRVAIRIPNHPIALDLLSNLAFPLAAPSANPFGYVSPTTARHVDDQLGEKIEYILDGGSCKVGLESTIIGFDGDKTIIHRLGGTSIEAITSLIGEVATDINQSSNPKAPGMLKSHYSPRKKVIIGDIKELINQHKEHKIGIISFSSHFPNIDANLQIQLSDKGDLNEAGANIFSALRQMDSMNIDCVLTEKFPEKGLGRAINDRLKRAAV